VSPSTLPDGEPVPASGSLPSAALAELDHRPLGVYLHIPFCRTRCGYCDFNTYTAAELGPGASRTDYVDTVIKELRLAGQALGGAPSGVDTVFVGGGTPTLLPPDDLVRLLDAVDEAFGLLPGAEITTESNPESVTAGDLAVLRRGGFTRVSFGMQSAVDHVLAVLDRQHTPGRAVEAVAEARAAGFEQVSLDLIYGAPGESLADWRTSLETAIAAGPDHLSAYALIVEPGTRLAADIRAGRTPAPDEDEEADKYALADELLEAAGMRWYELSNWARGEDQRCRHNLGYWTGHAWWGFGPGAHSHVGGVRWWNVKHPAAYAQRLAAGASPAHARERLDPDARRVERVLLESRLVTGLDPSALTATERARVSDLVERGLIERAGHQHAGESGQLVLTLRGRLLADAVVRDLLD